MFRASFKEVFKDTLKHINSLSKKVCFVVVVCHSSQLPEQKEQGRKKIGTVVPAVLRKVKVQ